MMLMYWTKSIVTDTRVCPYSIIFSTQSYLSPKLNDTANMFFRQYRKLPPEAARRSTIVDKSMLSLITAGKWKCFETVLIVIDKIPENVILGVT